MGLELSEAVNKEEKEKERERETGGKETGAWLTPPDCGREGIFASRFYLFSFPYQLPSLMRGFWQGPGWCLCLKAGVRGRGRALCCLHAGEEDVCLL